MVVHELSALWAVTHQARGIGVRGLPPSLHRVGHSPAARHALPLSAGCSVVLNVGSGNEIVNGEMRRMRGKRPAAARDLAQPEAIRTRRAVRAGATAPPYGTAADHADVSPDSKPSINKKLAASNASSRPSPQTLLSPGSPPQVRSERSMAE